VSDGLAGPVLYDDPLFFARYRDLRAGGAGLNEDLEQPALAALLPDVRAACVLDLGCGVGALARRLAEAGPHPLVRYLRADIETLNRPAGSADLVVSSLALHYVRDYARLIRRIAGWLRPGGRLVFSVEHPVCTAASPMTGWLAVDGAWVWPVDQYGEESPRTQDWLGRTVVKYHRRVATLAGEILAAGLVLTGLDEPCPDAAAVARKPALAQHRRRPPLLILAARKPGQPAGWV
jgi:SAM-dependent methyltransferase